MKDQNNTNEQIDNIDNEYRKAIGAIILGEILGKSREEILDDVGLECNLQ